MSARVAHLPAARYQRMPWRNGGGVTHEVLVGPAAATLAAGFGWRISFAEVAAEGPFSVFPGCERTLTLVEGALTLGLGERAIALAVGVPFGFAGDVPCVGRLPAGPARDFNVITHRERARHVVSIVPAGADTERLISAPLLVAVALATGGRVTVDGAAHALPDGDTLVVEGAGRLRVAAAGPVALVAITPLGGA